MKNKNGNVGITEKIISVISMLMALALVALVIIGW